jgi:hypothetical protein
VKRKKTIMLRSNGESDMACPSSRGLNPQDDSRRYDARDESRSFIS